MLMFPPPYTIMLLLLGLGGKLLNGLYAAKDLGLKGGGKRSLGSLCLHFKRLHLLEWAIT